MHFTLPVFLASDLSQGGTRLNQVIRSMGWSTELREPLSALAPLAWASRA